MTVPALRDLCKATVLKFGLQPRHNLPDALPLEMSLMEMLMRIDMTGLHYSDYHVAFRHSCELDLVWSEGEWTIEMRHFRVRHMAKIRAGERTHLVHKWKKIFLFVNDEPYPGLDNIVIHNFEIELEKRSVVFEGSCYNHHSGDTCQFQTKFTFSATSHLLKLQTTVTVDGIPAVGGRRFLRQPDTENYDFLR